MTLNAHSAMKYFFILIAYIFITGCASQYDYDPDNPEAYKKHWENKNSIKDNEFFYQISEECRENKDKDCIDF
jgi:outer membrane biogenesis lipoprotein LolB